DRQPQPARTRRPEHQPVRSPREVLVGQRLAEQLVVGPEVFHRDARLWNAGRPARLEDEHWFAGEAFRNPALHRAAAQPFVLEQPEPLQLVERLHFAARVESGLLRELQPERRAGRRIEMPVDDLANPGVERLARGWRGGRHTLHDHVVYLQEIIDNSRAEIILTEAS